VKSALPFDWRDALVRVDEVLSAPPAIDRIQRPVLRGTLVKRFVLPLELCKPLNQLSRVGTASAGWALGKLKRNAFQLMLAQNRGRIETPLSGRPQVVCVRFSSVEPDHESGWCKNPVDRLRVGRNGLGLIVDDKPRNIELITRWEKAPRRLGAVLVEVWSGDNNDNG
jgi:hypothetical protein